MTLRFTACVLALVLIAGAVHADEIVFKNGDRLTGTIKSAEAGKLVITSTVAGEVTVNMADVATFSTDEPIELVLSDGSTIRDRIEPAADAADAVDAAAPPAPDEAGEAPAPEAPPQTTGTIRTAGSGTVAPQALPIDQVEKINPPPVRWTGSFVLGGMITRGNSDTQSVNATLDAVRRAEIDRITVQLGYLMSRQEDPTTGDKDTTADNWWGDGKYDYFFSEKFYGYANVRVERDRIADLDLRLMPGVGVGYQWIEQPDLNFNTEAGLSWVYENYRDGGSEEHLAARLAYHLDKSINDKVSLFHNLQYFPSLEELSDFNLIADAGVRATLVDNMFAELKGEWRYDATPAPGREKDDLRISAGVGWSY